MLECIGHDGGHLCRIAIRAERLELLVHSVNGGPAALQQLRWIYL